MPRTTRMINKKKTSPMMKVIAVALALSFVGFIVITALPGGSLAPRGASTQSDAQSQRFESDARMYEQMLELDTSNTTSLALLGNVYFDWGFYLSQNEDFEGARAKWTQAQEVYEKALVLDPANLSVKTDLGVTYFYTMNLDRARQIFDEVLIVEPTHAQALFNSALVSAELNNHRDAVARMQRFVDEYPDDPNTQAARRFIEENQAKITETTVTTIGP